LADWAPTKRDCRIFVAIFKGELGYAGFVKIAEIDARLQQPYQPFTDT